MDTHSIESRKEPQRAGLPTVLAVDDVYLSLLLIKETLAGMVNLYIARSAEDAIKVLDLVKVDLLLLDLEMPKMTGFQFLEQMHEMPAYQNTPVIIVSSNVKPSTLGKTLEYGVVDFIVKPFSPALLREKVIKVISAM